MQRLFLFFVSLVLLLSSCTKDNVPTPNNNDGDSTHTTPPPPTNVSVTVTTIAGKVDDQGDEDGNGAAARFWKPTKMVYDSRNNLLYIADGTVIRSMDAQNKVETYMPFGAISRWSEILDMSLAPGAGGSLYITTAEHDLLKIEPDGSSVKKTVLIDRIYGGNETGDLNSADQLDGTHGVATGKNGEIYFFNAFWNTMRRVTVSAWSPVEGSVEPFAGKPTTTRSGDAWDFSDGQGEAASFGGAVDDIASDGQGNIYVADYWNDELRMVVPSGNVTSLLQYMHGVGIDKDGPVGTAQANHVTQIAASQDGSLIFFGTLGAGGNTLPRLRVVKGKKEVLTLTKSGTAYGDGTGETAGLFTIGGLACTPDGKTVFVSEPGRKVIRKVVLQNL